MKQNTTKKEILQQDQDDNSTSSWTCFSF